MHPSDEDEDDLEDDDRSQPDERWARWGRVDHLEEREDDENFEPDEDDKDAEWYEDHFLGPDEDEEDEIAAELDDEEECECNEGGGRVTEAPLAKSVGRHRHQSSCWRCGQSVDDESLPRCSTGCGWVRCRCGSCLCDMPLNQRLERPHTVKIRHILAAVRYCPSCRGVGFRPSLEELNRRQLRRMRYVPDVSQFCQCRECCGKGYLTT